MSSSNNSNRKDDGSIITVDEFKSKVNQGKCFAGLAFSALLKADQELKENGEISSSTRNMLFMIQFNCLATSRALGLAAGDIELNSTGSSSVSKVLSNLAYELDQYVQQIKIFLKVHNMGYIPQEFSALLTAMASPTKEPGSPPSSIAMSVKRKRASKGIAGPALKRADDGDFTKSIQVYDSDGQTDEDDNNDDATVTTNNTSTVSTLTDSFKKSMRPQTKCICGTLVDNAQITNHLRGSGLTSGGSGKKRHTITIHTRKLMELYYEKGEAGFTDFEQKCLDKVKDLFTRMLTQPKSQKVLADHTEKLIKGNEIEGNHMINFVHCFLPEIWPNYMSILTLGSAAAEYAAGMPPHFLDTKPAAAAANSSNETDGPPSFLRSTDVIPEADDSESKSLPSANGGKPPSLKSAIRSPPSGTVASKSIEDLQPPGEEELIPFESGTRHASTAVAAPNTPVGQTHNAVFNTSGPTVDAPRASHAQRRTSTTSASMSSTGITSNVFGAGITTIPTTSNTSNAHSLLSDPNERGGPPANPTGGGTAENPFDMLERLLRLKKLATESQSDSLAAKIDKRIKILENELFPDL